MSLFPRALVAASLPLLLAACATTIPAAAPTGPAVAPRVSVVYLKDKDYTDFSRTERDRLTMEKDLTSHFAALAQRLPAGQTLTIDVSDIDLAGRIDYGRARSDDLRIMTGRADWPQMTLHYTLASDGVVLRSADASLSDMDYQNHLSLRSNTEPLRYEKQMIDDWFQKTFMPWPARCRPVTWVV